MLKNSEPIITFKIIFSKRQQLRNSGQKTKDDTVNTDISILLVLHSLLNHAVIVSDPKENDSFFFRLENRTLLSYRNHLYNTLKILVILKISFIILEKKLNAK